MAIARPLVTVLTRVYNGDRYIHECIESVLNQTLQDLELLVVDDGSTDSTPAVLQNYASDERLRIVRKAHEGVSVAARLGVEAARGVYVAIMDADDRSHPNRLRKQIQFLEQNRDHVLVGSAMRIINGLGAPTGLRRYPLTDAETRCATMLYNPFAHSSICFRRADALACGSYTSEFPGAEDFDFNVRIRMRGKAANLPDPLIDYRLHPGAFKVEHLRRQLRDTILLRSLSHARYGYPYGLKARLVDIGQRALLFMPPRLVNRLFEIIFIRSLPPVSVFS